MSSRYSDAASEFGRRLTLDSSSDMARTRLQDKKEAERKAAAAGTGKKAGKATAAPKATAGSSKVQSSGGSSRGRARPPAVQREESSSDDDDEDDDDESESDDEAEDNGRGERAGGNENLGPAPVSPTIQRRAVVFAIMCAYEPSALSPSELTTAPANHLSEPSRTYRNVVENISRLVRDNDDLSSLLTACPLNGEEWGYRIVSNLKGRADRNLATFKRGRPTYDSLRTLNEYQRIYSSVEGILYTPYLANIHPAPKKRLILLLVECLADIVSHDYDVRNAEGPGQFYAGGRYEFNVYMRFASSQETWSRFLELLRRLASRDAALFHAPEVHSVLRRTSTNLRGRHGNSAPNESVLEFYRRFSLLVQTLLGE